ncbi:putative transglycosylase IsaA precursor [Jeotgalicoccus saudimassiliensis]|uniref:Putative transglycosylase IsaA n=1 Tax=Jeotgalicoccus saudimassiliensis TaxID=1461582 RepID=A0A078M7V8_9STAP|nr:hypothetical protein [Jeotgalicoccus saudimassiliensis]CEA02379.1 putative transglycosylase IsaA precursor [Jeotgalicoccus saudimassiliensis]
MKKVTLLGSVLVAGALTFTGVNGHAAADDVEEEGAKTVWGEVLPSDADPDGDGWANTGFDVDWMSQEGQNRVADLSESKDNGELSQVEYNEAVAEVFKIEQELADGDVSESTGHPAEGHQDAGQMSTDVDRAHLADLALNSPDVLNAAPLQEEPYNYNFVYGDYGFHFSYDGTYWKWSYDELKPDFSEADLIYLAHNNPAMLNKYPAKAGKYDFKLYDDNYVYHFQSDGYEWTWVYEPK